MTIEELKQALEAATPGPLIVEYYDDFEDRIEITCEARKGKVAVAEIALGFKDSFDAEQKANARLIVEAVNNLPKLLKVAQAAEKALAYPAEDEMRMRAQHPLRKALEELNDEPAS